MQAAIETAGHTKSLAEIVDTPTIPKLANLQQQGGERATFGIVKALLVAMNNNLHIDNSLTEANIDNIARMLTTDDEVRYWLTLADIDLLCRQIVQGHFGKYYGHFSEQEFNTCLIAYCNERREHHRRQAEKTVEKENENILHEVNYTIDKEGHCIFKHERDNFPQPLYLYDDHGKRTGINPKGYFGQQQQARQQQLDRELAMAKELMKNDRDLTLDEAINKIKAMNNNQ